MATNDSAAGNASGPGAEIVNDFAAVLFPDDESDKSKSSEQTESEATEAEEEVASDEPEAEEAAEESEESGDEESADEGDESAASKYRVRVDGEEVEVTLDELLSGYSRTQDYTRKTMALANDRKTVEQERQAARQEREQYAALIPQVRQLLEGAVNQVPNWDQLRREDPVSFATQWAEYQQNQQRIAAIRAEEQRVAGIRQAEQAKALQERLQSEATKLVKEVLPQWSDAKVRTAETAKIRDLMLKAGFGEDELDIADARAVGLLWKAMKYEEIQSKKPAIEKKVAVAKTLTPGQKPKPQSEARKAGARLAKTGTVQDAAALFAASGFLD